MADKIVEHLVRQAVQGLRVKPTEEKKAPAAPVYDPHLDDAIARLEGIVAEREALIAKVESDRTAAVGTADAVVAGMENVMTGLALQRNQLALEADAADKLADITLADAEKEAREHLAACKKSAAQAVTDAQQKAQAILVEATRATEQFLSEAEVYAGSLLEIAKTTAACHRATRDERRAEGADVTDKFTAVRDRYCEHQAALASVAGPFDEQLEKLRKGKYADAIRRLPELRARRARRQVPESPSQPQSDAEAKVEETKTEVGE